MAGMRARHHALHVRGRGRVGVAARGRLHRRKHHPAGAAVHIHQAFAAHRRADEAFTGSFNAEFQARAPQQRVVAIHFQLVVFQIDKNDLLFRARRLERHDT